MTLQQHDENRQWILDALSRLETFVKTDEDFLGDRVYETKAIGYQRVFVRDGKYRVVFLGAFNVGKSTAINAFLGGGYLPMDIEECTSRLTFIQRGDDLRLTLALETPASQHEIEALERALSPMESVVEAADNHHELTVRCARPDPDLMRQTLELLVTVAADEEHPHLAPLREKTEALTLHLPSDALEEDIVLVDTPGVHSLSETRQKITYGIIEHSHLVVSFVDGAFVGNIHDLNFIKRIITCRGRRVFFVLNKADKLEQEEIDPHGVHGPAASLVDTFRRHDIPEDSEIFFLSGYRALRALELERGHLTLAEALDDNKLLIPTAVIERIANSANPTGDLAGYLMGQSRFPHLKERLLDYLVHENKANAVFELADRFIHERAVDCLISIRNALILARDPAKFEELRANRDALLQRIEVIRQKVAEALDAYVAVWRGGETNGAVQPGYAAHLRTLLSEAAIEERVIAPTIAWLREGRNLAEARRNKFQPLTAQLEHQVDVFVADVMARMHVIVEANENEAGARIAEQIELARDLRECLTSPETVRKATVQESVSREYMACGAGGAAVGAMTGALVGSAAPVVGTAIGAGLGGLLGAVLGFLARLAWSEERWIRKLTPTLRKNALDMLIQGGPNDAKPIVQGLEEHFEQRASVFKIAIEGELNNAADAVQRECDALLAREQDIRRERDVVIARLESKETFLEELRTKAEEAIALRAQQEQP